MLALTFIRYWWLRPIVQDPQHMETPDDMKSESMTSLLDPLDAPQYDVIEKWSKIPYGTLDPMQHSVIEIEKALAKGKDTILIEPSVAGQVYTHYVSHGWLLQENTVFYGSIGLLVSYLFPNWWHVYVPCSVLALMHSWMYFRVYKHDRLSQYQAYYYDRHPVSNLIAAWVLGQRTDHFQYVLKKERVIVWEIISELIMYSSVISTLYSLKSIKGSVVGNRYISLGASTSSLDELLLLPAYHSGYFQPPELVPVSSGTFLPADIPYVTGWFDLPWFNFHLKPMKFDLAIIICGIGGFFVYKMFEHFFGYSDDDEADGAREWLANEANIVPTCYSTKNPYWVELYGGEKEPLMETGLLTPSKPRFKKALVEQEEKMIERIARQKPYGWVPAGYSKNHYGVFK